ncbi:hypothetical protein VI817_003939 [Penicillium citrinum]|nr:hypothetical protein VI817_003939 [Penicillium citrinum]
MFRRDFTKDHHELAHVGMMHEVIQDQEADLQFTPTHNYTELQLDFSRCLMADPATHHFNLIHQDPPARRLPSSWAASLRASNPTTPGRVRSPAFPMQQQDAYLLPASPAAGRQATGDYRPAVKKAEGHVPACLVNASVTYCSNDHIYAFGGFDQYTDEGLTPFNSPYLPCHLPYPPTASTPIATDE